MVKRTARTPLADAVATATEVFVAAGKRFTLVFVDVRR